ncbi:hypothetical protein [Enterobacter cancerogenus]
MSFIDTVKYVRQLSVVDEFGGRGDASNISKFYIVFGIMDDNGNNLQVSLEEIEAALMDDIPGLVVTDYMGTEEWHIGLLDKDVTSYFKLAGVDFRNNVNIITVKVNESFTQDAAICVKFQQSVTDDEGKLTKAELVSSSYLSDFPSTFYLKKRNI